MQSCPVGKSINKHSSQPMISPFWRDINLQICRIVSADVQGPMSSISLQNRWGRQRQRHKNQHATDVDLGSSPVLCTERQPAEFVVCSSLDFCRWPEARGQSPYRYLSVDFGQPQKTDQPWRTSELSALCQGNGPTEIAGPQLLEL